MSDSTKPDVSNSNSSASSSTSSPGSTEPALSRKGAQTRLSWAYDDFDVDTSIEESESGTQKNHAQSRKFVEEKAEKNHSNTQIIPQTSQPPLISNRQPEDWAEKFDHAPDHAVSEEERLEYESELRLLPSWRYPLISLLCFVAFSAWAVVIAEDSPNWSVLSTTIPSGDSFLTISIPTLIIPALFFLGRAFFIVHNRYAFIQEDIMRYTTGACTAKRRVVNMETGSMLVVEVGESLFDKLKGVGTVSVGRFSRNSMEVEIAGIRDPYAIAKQIHRRIELARKLGDGGGGGH